MQRLGKKILEIKDISKAYDSQTLIDSFTYTFKKGEHIGVIGPNGVGKSTLLNILTGKVHPDKGDIVRGQTLSFGYYTQEGMNVPAGERLIDIAKEIADIVPYGKKELSISQFLAHFNFDHSTQYNLFGNLSGGEKRRFYLLMTLLKNPNFLILDEPTNDLDIFTLNVLENFLEQYPGCLLIVSHDRRFLDALAEHSFVFRGNGDIKVFPGNYSQYEEYAQKEESQKKKAESEKKRKAYEQEKAKKKPVKKVTFKEKKEFEELEQKISELEQEKEKVLADMDTVTDNEKLTGLSNRFSEITEELEEKELRWLELSEKMEGE
jgi:ATP-binding cassette subfamily F protein uup